MIYDILLKLDNVETKISMLASDLFKGLITIIKWRNEDTYHHEILKLDTLAYQAQLHDFRIGLRVKKQYYFKWMFEEMVECYGVEGIKEHLQFEKERTHGHCQLIDRCTDDEVVEKLRVLYDRLCNDLEKNTFVTLFDYIYEWCAEENHYDAITMPLLRQ